MLRIHKSNPFFLLSILLCTNTMKNIYFEKNIKELTKSLFSKNSNEVLTDESIEEIVTNFTNFFEILLAWENSNKEDENE